MKQRSEEAIRLEILEEFAEHQWMSNERTVPCPAAGGLEALRVAYRERNKAAGLCIFCPRPCTRGRGRGKLRGELLKYCEYHRQKYRAAYQAKIPKRTCVGPKSGSETTIAAIQPTSRS